MLSLRDKAELGLPTNYLINGGAESSTTSWLLYNDSQTVTITIASPAVFTVGSTTGMYAGMSIAFTTTGALPTGLTANTTYYISTVINSTTFRVSATLGGSDVNTSGTQSGTHTARPLVPLDGTGGTVSGLTFSASSSSPLRGLASFLLAQANSTVVAGQGISRAFTIDNADQAKVLSLQFDFNASSTFSASSGQVGSISDLQMFIYDVTNAVLIPVTPSVITANGSNNFLFKATFQSSYNSTSYRLCIHSATTNANATGWTFKWDGCYLGPQSIVQGAPVTDPVAYIPTFSAGWGTVTNVTFRWSRSGKYLTVEGTFQTGTVAASIGTISLPSGLSISSDIPANATTYTNFGEFGSRNNAAGTSYIIGGGGDTVVAWSFSNGANNALTPLAVNALLGSASYQSVKFKVPIQGWSSSVVMSSDMDNRIVAACYDAATDAASPTAPIQFNTLVFDTTASVTTGAAWNFRAPISGFYLVIIGISTSNNGSYQIYKNGTLLRPVLGGPAGSSTFPSGGAIIQLIADEYIDIRAGGAYASTGIASFYICKISGNATLAASAKVYAKYRNTTNFAASATTPINFDSKVTDTNGAVATSSTAWMFKAPDAGTFRVSGSVVFNTAGNLYLYKNGSFYEFLTALPSINTGYPFSSEIPLLVGEYIDFRPSVAATTGGGSSPNFAGSSVYVNISSI